ncbi:triple functional domain protein-like [Syngnathoides biaculeatus]|uniref:triple functional domain protein-like n=1 Tax=Syngnathoides biaculeatus TaxID=300417 RepID=UPI002ADDCF45|nr:triple functional domain protein-like [Syngnathoides biaculeatus]
MEVQQNPEALPQTDYCDMDLIRECGESTASIWLQFLGKTENKVKMLNTIVAFYKITAKMCRALEIFEEEYKKEEDKLDPNCGMDNLTSMIRKHLKRKESFFKVKMSPWKIQGEFLCYTFKLIVCQE